jgi:hypothetical protein
MLDHKPRLNNSDNSGSDQDNSGGLDPLGNGAPYGVGAGATSGAGAPASNQAVGSSQTQSSSQIVSSPSSKISFNNTYAGGDTQAFINDVVAAEQTIQSHWTSANAITINFDFIQTNQGDNGDYATNDYSYNTYTYSQLVSALKSHASSGYAQLAMASLPANNPDGGNNNVQDWALPQAYAEMLGLIGSNATDTVTLNTYYNPTYGQDVVNALIHEISEGGMGRTGSLGDAISGDYEAMDLFRYNAAGAPDYTDGRDGQTTYFSYNGGISLSSIAGLSFNNQYNSNGNKANGGDVADWTQQDVFGFTDSGETNVLSQTDIEIMDVLGWQPVSGGGTPMMGDFFIARESVTGDFYYGYIYDNQAKYTVGSGFTSTTVDAAGGHWSYYVYSTAASSVSASYNGQVFDTAYYDADEGAYYTPYFYSIGYASGTNFLGSDTDYINLNYTEQKFGDQYYVVPEMKADYFIAYESKTGDKYYGFVYDDQGKYAVGSSMVSATDQAGGTWTYYVYSIGSAPTIATAYNGQVYDTSYYDSNEGTSYTPFYYGIGYASGTNWLGSDTDYINLNYTEQKFSSYYVVPDMNKDYFIAYESKTGDEYFGYVYDDQGRYSVGSTLVTPTDQAGGKWTYYVDAIAPSPTTPTAYNGQVYDYAYYDVGTSGTPYTPFYYGIGYASGQNFLGSDTDYILENSAYQKFGGDGFYVVGGASGTSGAGQSYTPYGATQASANLGASGSGNSALITAPSNQHPLTLTAAA